MVKCPLQESTSILNASTMNQKVHNISKKSLTSKALPKLKGKKKSEEFFQVESSPSNHAELYLSDQILGHVFSRKAYPQKPSGKQKIRKDIKSLLQQVTNLDGDEYLFEKCYDLSEEDLKSPFLTQEITIEKRLKLVVWMIQIHRSLKQRQESLHRAVWIVDEFCKKIPLTIVEYQLLGITSLFVSAKYEEILTPCIQHFLVRINDLYTRQQIFAMESRIFIAMEFDFGKKVTSLWFLEAFGMIETLEWRKSENQNKNSQISQNNGRQKSEKNSKNDILSFEGENNDNKQNIPEMLLYLPKSSKCTQIKDKHHDLRPKQSALSVNETERTFLQKGKNEKFIYKCKYFLNLILLDYKIIKKFQPDVIAISVLIFKAIYKGKKYGIDSEQLYQDFLKAKLKALPGMERSLMKAEIKKCMQKIGMLYEKRFNGDYQKVNQKWSIEYTKK